MSRLSPEEFAPEAAWKAWRTRTTPPAAELLAMQNRLETSQWLSAEQISEQQFRSLRDLVAHAAEQVPFYRDMFERVGLDPRAPLTERAWNSIPVLKRSELRDRGDMLFARSYPKSFGTLWISTSGGSTGIPVRVRKTALDNWTWTSIALREETWHRESVDAVLANLRGASREAYRAQEASPGTVAMNGGLLLPDWGSPTNLLWETGRMAVLQPDRPVSVQVDFLANVKPDYLYIRPTELRLLLAHMRQHQIQLPKLRAVWTLSEQVDDSLRAACLESFGCRIVSNYTAGETGYIALQCPLGRGYHVMSEVIHVEILDADGLACAPGEIGRVVVTPLYNYAMPLLRYELGDEAEVGAACACGRGLPVLSRIVGRIENYLTLKTGERRPVHLSHRRISAIREIREFQLAQTGPDRIELRLAVWAPLKHKDLALLNDIMDKSFGTDFAWQIVYLDVIPKTASGKLLQFVNAVGAEQGSAPGRAPLPAAISD
jgi:phenylacetate-CoA ligase